MSKPTNICKPTSSSVHAVKEHYMSGTQTSKYNIHMNAANLYIIGSQMWQLFNN